MMNNLTIDKPDWYLIRHVVYMIKLPLLYLPYTASRILYYPLQLNDYTIWVNRHCPMTGRHERNAWETHCKPIMYYFVIASYHGLPR